jgi:hypothetical protein
VKFKQTLLEFLCTIFSKWKQIVLIVSSVCSSVRMFQLQNFRMNFDEIWYECYTIGGYPEHVLFLFPIIGNTNVADAQTCEVGATPALLNTGSWNGAWCMVVLIDLRKVYNILRQFFVQSKTPTLPLHEAIKLAVRTGFDGITICAECDTVPQS